MAHLLAVKLEYFGPFNCGQESWFQACKAQKKI